MDVALKYYHGENISVVLKTLTAPSLLNPLGDPWTLDGYAVTAVLALSAASPTIDMQPTVSDNVVTINFDSGSLDVGRYLFFVDATENATGRAFNLCAGSITLRARPT